MAIPVSYRLPGEGKVLRLGPGEYLTDKATTEETGGAYTLYEVVSAQDSGVPLHQHDWAEAFYVLEGEYELSFVDENGAVQRITAGPGTWVNVPAGGVHAFRNTAPGFSKMLSLNAPVGLEPLVRQLGIPCDAPGGTPERDEIPLDEFRAGMAAGGITIRMDLMEAAAPGAWKGAPS
jgi:quercetin dioxygenase-like cupin family protein